MPDINGAIQNATVDTAMGAAVGESAGDIATDIVLDELIDALVEEYAKASIEMQGKCDNYLSKYAKEDAEKRSLLDAKKISKEDYQTWQKSKILGGKQWTDMRDTLAQDLTHCNEIAADIINDRKCDVYALNRNYGTYEIEQGVGACTSYTLYDHDTVERLISQNPELLPKTKIDIPKDLQWNKQQLTSAVTQGILQGESIPSIAKRMAAVTDMDKNSAIRNARTATTGAENAGRVESYKRAEKMGIKVTQIWISTLDGRTRTSHRHMMGEKRALGKAFSNKCRFPGDPQGPGWEVYNCFIPETNIACDSEILRSYKHYYEGEIISIKTARGVNFSCTPNHPILTNRGWVAAKFLNKGDHLIVTRGINCEISRSNPNINEAFPSIEAVHNLFNKFGGKRTRTLRVNFHGDIPASDVEIITKKRLLWNNRNSCCRKSVNKFLLKLTDFSLMRECSFMKHLWGVVRTTFSDICSASKKFAVFFRRLGHSVIHRSRTISDRDIVLPEYSINDLPTNSVFDGESLVGLTGKVFLDDIISVKFGMYSGHVYNLQTDNHYYFVNNITQSEKKYDGIFAIAHNCRCTLIAEPDGSGYDLEKTIDKNLSKKGMTFDEWVNQQPLPRHYGESKQHYLERYAKHKKQLSFGEWLGEQAAPDSAIQSVWGDKKMSQMYNEIKAQSVTDANKFYKELGKLGKPSEVWEKYLTGQLDAEDMKNFEDILKKYLPAPTTNAAAPIFTAKYEGKISKEAQDSLDKLKFKAGNPMDKDAADSYKVNPLYDKADKATTKNCQTSAFAYECRRQGYDVVALPKYGLDIDDPELKEILQLQNTLGKNARLGWINKETGAPATLVIEHSNPMLVMSNSEMIDELENAIGKSGERYIMGVRWKGTTSCHAINIDRTPDGKLRIIDNQRGPLEKNTWVGKEVEDYLDSVQRIKHVTRVDDCVPNAEYFNKIVVDAKKVKADLPSNVSAFKDYSKVSKQAKDAGEKTSTYYTKWKAGLIDNKDLDDLLTHGVAPKVDLDTYKANLLKDPKLENMLDDIAIEAAKDNQLFTNDYLMAYLKGEKQNDYLDNMLKKNLPSPDPALTKADDIAKHNDDILKYYKDKSLYDADVPMEVAGISVNKYFKAGLNSASDYWNKYKLGEIKDAEIDKILGIKSVSTSTPVSAPVSAKADFIKKWENTSFKNLPDDAYAKVMFGSSNKGIPASEYWEKYLAGEIKNSKLDEILSLPDSIQNVEFIHPATGEVLNKFDELEKIKNMPVTNLDDMAQTLVKDYYDLKLDDAKQILKDLGLNIPEKTTETIVSALEIAKEELKSGLDTGSWSAIYFKVAGIDSDLAHELKDIAAKIKVDKGFGNKYEVLSAYFDGTLKSTELDDIFTKIYKDKIPTASTTASTFDKTAALSKYDTLTDLKYDLIDVGGEDLFNEIHHELHKLKQSDPTVTMVDTYKKYKNGEISSKKLDDLFDEVAKKLNPTPVPASTTKTNDILDKSKLPQSMGAMDDEMFNEVAEILNNKGVDDNTSHYKKWLKGKVDDEDLDKYFGISTSTPVKTTPKATTAVDIDAVKNKKVTAVYNEIKADLGTSEANAFYNKTLKEIGSKNSWSQGEVWKKYLAGDLDADDVKKIDDHLIKKYSKTVEPPKPVFDTKAFENKKMSQVYNDIKATDTATANKFYNDLKKMGKPSEVWDEYLKGNLPQDKADIIEAHLKKKYMTSPSAQSKAATAADAATDLEAKKKLDEAKKKLDEATQELETIKKELPNNKTYSGIWKEDVTLEDYPMKKDKIGAKKQYYYDEIETLEHCIDDPDSWQFKKYGGESGLNKKIAEYEKYIDDLDKFEKEGQEYLAKKTEVDKKIKTAEKKVADAKKTVSDLTPASEAYTQERKDAAKWFTSKSYKDGDKYYSALPATKAAHKSATSAEHSAYIGYTSASGGFNRPLAGFKAPQYSGGSGWDEKYYKGVGNVPLDNENKGKDIKNLTTFVEKSKMEDDIWVQTAQNYATLEGKNGFLGVPYGSLSGMTDSQLQQFVGVENQLGQFISASINRGGGSYTPGNMRINIYCPKGSEALYVLSDGTFGKSEHEIILQRGGTYKVSKIYWGTDAEHGGKKLIVDLELRLEKGYNKYEK